MGGEERERERERERESMKAKASWLRMLDWAMTTLSRACGIKGSSLDVTA